MIYRVKVSETAARQIREAADWWHGNRGGAMDALADDLERAFDLITRQPRIGKMADPPDPIYSRRIYLHRIHYFLYYSVDDRTETVEVLAFWHVSRGSSPEFD